MESYIKLYRKIRNTSVWCDSDKLKLWLYCLTEASYEDRTILHENKKIDLKKGQFITGRNKLEMDFNNGVKNSSKISGSTLVRWLELFEKCEMLHIEKTNKYSVVTVLNWDKYQQNEQQMNNSCTTDEQQMNNSCTHIKKYKKYKKDKNIYLLLKDGTNFIVTENDIEEWKNSFPKVDVRQEFLKMESWCKSNPTKRKTKSGIKRFINSWLSRATETDTGLPDWYSNTKQQPNDPELEKEIEQMMKEIGGQNVHQGI